MSGIFSSFNTATKGLMAQQTALHTTGHNISNVNTPGYTRQRVDLQADQAFNFAGVGQLGTGVKMTGIQRMIDNHVSKQLRDENSTLNRFAEKSGVIDHLEVIFNEPSDTGLDFNISELFDALQNLSGNVENLNFKTVAVEKFKTLVNNLNHMAGKIEDLEKETHESIDKNVLDFNSKVDQLKTLNKQIFNISIKGQVPNDLLDQRDIILKEVTSIADVQVDFDEYGRVDIKMGDQEILTKEGTQKFLGYADVDGKRKVELYTEKYDPDSDPAQESKGVLDITNGKILGNMDALEDIQTSKTDLDDLANIMGTAMNKVQGDFIDVTDPANPVSVGSIFTGDLTDGKFTAKNIKINKVLQDDPSLLAQGKDAEGKPLAPGNNDLASALAELRTLKFDKGGTDDPENGNTIGGYYRDTVIKIGVSKQHSDNMIDNQISLTNQLEMRRESVSGVSLNDEITNVIKFQKAYEANAKVISVLTEMLDVLINRTGV